MENKSHALWAGFFTLVMLVTTVLGGIWLNRDKTERITYHIVTDRPISGLNTQASVRYKGLAVGRIEKINFDKNTTGQFDITISVDPNTPITPSTFATLGYQGVTGIAFVQLDDDGKSTLVNNGTKLPNKNQTLRIPLRPSLLDKLERSSSTILANAEIATAGLAKLFTLQNQKIILNTFKETSQTAASWSSVANALKPTLQSLPNLVQQTNQTLASIKVLAEHTTHLSQQLSGLTNQLQDSDGSFNQTLTNFSHLSERIQLETLPKITELSKEASYSLHILNKTLEEFKEQPQTLIFGRKMPAPDPGEAGFIKKN